MANLLSTTLNGSLLIGPSGADSAYNGAATGKLYFGNQVSDSPTHYHITTNMEDYNGNYSKLDFRWYTGQRFYAHVVYGGFRFHEITTNAELFSVGKGDAHVRVENNLYVGDTIYNNGNPVVHTGGGQTIAGTTYFSYVESLNLYGIRGRFTNEYIHLYHKVGIGHPGGWGQGEGNTPGYGLSTYGGATIAYGNSAGMYVYGSISTDTYVYTNASVRVGEIWGHGGLYRGSGDMMFGTEGGHWYFNNSNNTKAWISGANGDIWMSWSNEWLSNLLTAKQNASTAINTSNIGSQSVSNSDTVDGFHASQLTKIPLYTLDTQSESKSGFVAGGNWYRIANLGTERFFTRVRIYDDSSGGPHASVEFQVAGAFNRSGNYSFTLTSNGYYSAPSVTQVRILSQGTYDPQYLEVYISYVGYAASTFVVSLLEARNATVVNWEEGDVPAGYTATTWDANGPFATGGRAAKINTGAVISGGATINGSLINTGASYLGIIYDYDDNAYYLNPSGDSLLKNLSVGSTFYPQATQFFVNQGSQLNVENQGTFARFAFNNLDFYDWQFGQMLSINDGVSTFSNKISINAGNNYPLDLNGGAHKYIRIQPGNGWEAMVYYHGGTGSPWYVGKRTSSQLVGTDSFHFYSEAAGATVGGINPSGDMIVTGSMRAPVFYDSNDTTYYGDFASTSYLRHLSVGDVNASNDGSWNARLNLTGSYHARLDVKSNSDGIITTMYSHTGNGVGKVGTMSNHPLAFMVNGGIAGYAYANYLQGVDSVRAPIFYDSNDTYYYVDPNSTSRLVSTRILGEIRFQNGSYYNNLEYWGARMFSQDDGGGVPLYVQVQWAAGWRQALKIASGMDDNNPSLRTYGITQLASDGGFVGIRTTDPQAELDVNGRIAIRSSNRLYFGHTTTLNSWTTAQYASGSTHIFNAQTFVFNNEGYGSTEYMRITSGGNVGIGTNSPSYRLVVNKTSIAAPAIMVGGAFFGGPRIQTYGLDADSNAWMGLGTDMGVGNYEHSIYYSAYAGLGKLTFGTYDGTTYSTKMLLNSSGYLGIGTTSPSYHLEVAGNAYVSNIFSTPNYIKAKSTYRYHSTAGLPGQDTPVKTASGVLAAFGGNGGSFPYIIIKTRIPQDQYNMGGFTIDLFADYYSSNRKTTISLGGYWNPESNGGFEGFEYNTTNPNVRPDITVMRDITDGMTCFVISGMTWSYPKVIARDLFLGHSSADIEGGLDWSIFGADDLGGYINNDAVVCRNAIPADQWYGNTYIHYDGRHFGTIFYDSNDSAYYCDPNATSRLHIIKLSTDQWNQTSDGYNRFYFGNNARTYFGSGNGYEFRSAADANIASISNAGDFVAAGDVTAYSDARIKTNVQTIENALDKTLKLRGVTYTRTDSEDTSTKVGVIAQEILEVIPEVVKQNDEGMYSVSYGNLTAVLIEAIKEQQKQIDELKEIINGFTK